MYAIIDLWELNFEFQKDDSWNFFIVVEPFEKNPWNPFIQNAFSHSVWSCLIMYMLLKKAVVFCKRD